MAAALQDAKPCVRWHPESRRGKKIPWRDAETREKLRIGGSDELVRVPCSPPVAHCKSYEPKIEADTELLTVAAAASGY